MSFEYALNAEREMAIGMVREIVADNSKLRERNAKLREQNAKLRELVLDAWGNGHPDKSCGDCEILDECHEHMKNSPPFERCLFEVRIEERMRELGVTDD